MDRAVWLRLTACLLGAVVLALCLVSEPYLGVKEYTPYSIRGGGATAPGEAAGGGVVWDSATSWSFHPKELISFLFPSWFGLQGSDYWGPMYTTQSTHYFGIVALALALFGFWKLKGRRRFVWGGISLVVLLVGFGRHLPILYGPMFAVLPLFNRFRIPSMIYSLLPFCLGYLIAGGIDGLVELASTWTASRGTSEARPTTEKKRKGAGRAPRAAPARRVGLLLIATAAGGLLILLLAKAGLSGPQSCLRPQEIGRAAPEVLAMI